MLLAAVYITQHFRKNKCSNEDA